MPGADNLAAGIVVFATNDFYLFRPVTNRPADFSTLVGGFGRLAADSPDKQRRSGVLR